MRGQYHLMTRIIIGLVAIVTVGSVTLALIYKPLRKNRETVRFTFGQSRVITALSCSMLFAVLLLTILAPVRKDLQMVIWLIPLCIIGVFGMVRMRNYRVEVNEHEIRYRSVFRKERRFPLEAVSHKPVLGYRYTCFSASGFRMIRDNREAGVTYLIRNTQSSEGRSAQMR